MNNRGLSSSEATKILKYSGPNEFLDSKVRAQIDELKKIILDPMGLMLLALAGLHGLIGNKMDAIILLIVYIPIVAVDVLLELRAQRALKKMKARLQVFAKVIRDGLVKEIPAREIVVGDVLVFEEGQTLPADGKIIESAHLSLSEAALTGEAEPVGKSVSDLFFAGTSVLTGRGLGLVGATGKNTRYGEIARLLKETTSHQSPLQKKVSDFVKKFFFVAVILSLVLFGILVWRQNDYLKSLIVTLTFSMSAIPEEFPIVFSLYLSLGAWRLSRLGVIIRSLPSLEALGNVDVICVDKTGTLTEGRFQLEKTIPKTSRLSESFMMQIALMACEIDAVDPMESAIKEKGKQFNTKLSDWELVFDYPFDINEKYMSHVWESTSNHKMILAMKGSVEGVLEHCEIGETDKRVLLSEADLWAKQGYRLLGLAFREGNFLGERIRDEQKLQFIGFLLFTDPVRNSAKEAIQICRQAGIQVKMITGDHPMTALSVAKQIGIETSSDFQITGKELEELSAKDRENIFQSGAIFSRVTPQQKHQMVQVLKAKGQIVAMTGDGINDAPALKLADIGISMGIGATDVARSAASLILVKNDFQGLVDAIFEGKKIFYNLRKSFSYLISFHLIIIVLALVPPLLGWGEVLLPIHVLLLELIVHPVSAFAFENLPLPKFGKENTFFSGKRVLNSIYSGAAISIISLFFFWYFQTSLKIEANRSLTLAFVFLGNMFLVLKNNEFRLSGRLVLTEFFLLLVAVIIFFLAPYAEFLHLEF